MKKLILIALVYAGFYGTAGAFGIKPMVEQPKCYGAATGTIAFTISNGVAPYTYAWSNGLPATATQSGLAAGSYTVTITDHNGTAGTYTVVMEQATQLNPSTSASNVTTHGGNNGYVHLSVSGGTPQYNYLWSNGATTQNLSGLPSGTYTVTVTDSWGCTATASKIVTQPLAPQWSTAQHQGNQALVTGPKGDNNEANTEKSDMPGATNSTNEVATLSNEDVVVYPNPSSSTVSLRINSAISGEIEVISITGQKVMQTRIDGMETSIDLSTLTRGNYIVQVKADNGGVANKMITVIK